MNIPTNPAYIDEANSLKWIATVSNSNNKEVSFYAIDHCVEVLRPDGNQEKRCDGILQYDADLLFVELKVRGSSGWLSQASDQLEITYKNFRLSHDISVYANVEAYACNSLRPMVNISSSEILQKFKRETGLILRAQRDIPI